MLLFAAPGTAFYQRSIHWRLAGSEVRPWRVKSHFQSCLTLRDSEAGEDPHDELHEEEATASCFLSGGGLVYGRIMGGAVRALLLVLRMQPRWLGVGCPGRKGHQKHVFQALLYK